MTSVAPARSALGRAIGLATGAALLLATSITFAPPSMAAPTRQHGTGSTQNGHGSARVFPTHPQQGGGASHQTSLAAGSGPLAYGGAVDGIGVTTGAPRTYLVFYGSQWGTSSTGADGYLHFTGDPQGLAPRVQAVMKGIGTNNETWSGVMTQYCEGVVKGATSCPASASHVGYPTGGTLAGTWYDGSVASPSQASGHQLAVEGVAAAGHFGNTTASSNRNAQYVVVSPTGTNPDGFNTATGNFCAWHDWNGDTTMSGGAAASSYGDVAFTNLPYLTDAGTSCGQNYVNSGTAGTLDGVSIVEGHEYAETITDQNPAGGWTDTTGYENADKCAWVGVGGTGGAQDLTFATGSFAMQSSWSNDTNGCQISHPIVTNSANTVTVTNPGNQTSTVGTAVSLAITATDSASGQTLTYSATGLPAGLAISTTTGVISGTPTTAATSTTTVTAKDTTNASGSATFTWTVNPSGSSCTAGQKLGNPGFETGSAAPWTSTAGVLNNSTSEPAHSGAWDAWLDGYGTTHTDALSQSVTLPTGCSSYVFSFWMHIDTAETTTTTAYDTLTVKVGSTTLATYSNLNKSTGYVQKSFNLASYAGQTVTLTFSGTEDSSLQTSFVIDDTAMTVS